MDKSRFAEQIPGRLCPISTPVEDWAFVPNPLPPQWNLAGGLWPLVVEAREQVARLDGIGKTLPDTQLLLIPLQKREALRSSSLEGTYATPEELFLFDAMARPSSDRVDEWREVSNYGKALIKGTELLDRGHPFSLRMIKQLHRALLTGARGRHRSPGEFRRHQVHIGSDRRFVPPPANFLGETLDALERYVNRKDGALDPLVRCYLVHYQFETIHPFADGNGRVGRLLLAMMTYKWLDLSHPWLYMSAYFDKYKDEYIRYLFEVSAGGAWTQWVEFCLKGTVVQAKDSIRRCDELRKLKEQFHNAAGPIGPRNHAIIDELFSRPILTIPHVAERFGVTYPTAKADVDRLIKAGVLKTLPGKWHPRTFVAPEILKIAYSDD